MEKEYSYKCQAWELHVWSTEAGISTLTYTLIA